MVVYRDRDKMEDRIDKMEKTVASLWHLVSGKAGQEPLGASKTGQVGFIPKQVWIACHSLERVCRPGLCKTYASQGWGPHARHGL